MNNRLSTGLAKKEIKKPYLVQKPLQEKKRFSPGLSQKSTVFAAKKKNVYIPKRDRPDFPKIASIPEDFGTIHLRGGKRNIYFTLVNSHAHVQAVASTGYIRARGKLRKAIFILKKLVHKCVRLLIVSKLKIIHFSYSGFLPRKIRKLFTSAFKRQPGVYIYKFSRRQKIPHNGCRPPKKPRK